MSFSWGSDEWHLLDPWFLLAGPVAWALLVWRLRRERAALPAASVALFDELPRTLRARCVWLPPVLAGLALTLLVVALARPVTRDVIPLRSEGLDILLAIDVSSSMDEPDAQLGSRVRRVVAARDRALAFAKERPDDRIGLMVFARYAELRCPPTLDEEALAAFLRVVDIVTPNSEDDGTAIGVAIGQATTHLASDEEAGSRIVILLTDGLNNGEVDPRTAAELAADAGIKIYTIGFGQGARLPFGRTVEIDFEELEAVAEITGGEFFRARSLAELAAVYEKIDALETREIEDPRYRTTDRFELPLLAGLGVWLLSLLLEVLWLRGAP